MKRKLTTSGNSVCLRLDRTLKEILNVRSQDDFISITIENNKIILQKTNENEKEVS